MKQLILLIDFGSTDTKATLIDLTQETVLATTKTKTTVTSHLVDSYEQLKKQLTEWVSLKEIEQAEVLICSSAFGGFKMVAIGLTQSLTTDAAKRVALGAGTRILKTYSYHLSEQDVKEINALQPDVILLTGGTNGGNKTFIKEGAQKLLKSTASIPILIAGNETMSTEVSNLLKARGNYFTSDNVMPKVNVLNPDKTRDILRTIFFEKIIYAKGLGEIAKLSNKPVIPTPSAVLSAAKLLSEGTTTQKGLGPLAIVDVGGATTDVHSVSDNLSGFQEVIFEGLQEPFLKRTVEGDLGMRYSAMSLLETTGYPAFQTFIPKLSDEDIYNKCLYREQHPDFIPTKLDDCEFDYTIAKLAIFNAMRRHVGELRVEPRPHFNLYYQKGKDLRLLNYLIGTGGVIVHSTCPEKIISQALQKAPRELTPIAPQLMLDKNYLLSALGLLGEHYPETAFNILKQIIQPL